MIPMLHGNEAELAADLRRRWGGWWLVHVGMSLDGSKHLQVTLQSKTYGNRSGTFALNAWAMVTGPGRALARFFDWAEKRMVPAQMKADRAQLDAMQHLIASMEKT